MTDAEWLTCIDPKPMLEHIGGKGSRRKLRLFACGCCRVVWNLVRTNEDRLAVRVAEGYADGLCTDAGLKSAAFIGNPYAMLLDQGASVTCFLDFDTSDACLAADVLSRRSNHDSCFLVRCIFGNPFRAVTLDPSWLAWNDRTVPRIAEGIYEERRLPEGTLDRGRLAILSDALLDAGCDNEELIAHCRSPGPHVRGCWAIDQILEKT